MRSVHTLLLSVLLAACLGVSGAGYARAQATPPSSDTAPTGPAVEAPDPEASIAEARRRYAQGAEFYRRGRFVEAIAEFNEAYLLWANPTILYALGQAYEGSSEVGRAIETYQRYLETASEEDIRRTEVAVKIEVLRGLLATVHIASNAPATVYVDDEQVGTAPGDFRVATGRHAIELRADGYTTQTQTLTIAGGTERTLTFELVAVSATVVRVERQRFRFPRPVFYTAVGLTGAGLVTWGSMATVALVRANDYNDTPGSTNFDREDARDAARRSNIALALTGGFVGTTALIGALTQWRRDADDSPPMPVVAAVEPIAGGVIVTAGWTR